MDPVQEKFFLVIDYLDEKYSKKLEQQLTQEDYQIFCNLAYILKERKVFVCPARIVFNPKTNLAYTPSTHEDGGYPSRNLYTDLHEIQDELRTSKQKGFESWDPRNKWKYSKNPMFDEKTTKVLDNLKKDLQEKGIEKLIQELN